MCCIDRNQDGKQRDIIKNTRVLMYYYALCVRLKSLYRLYTSVRDRAVYCIAYKYERVTIFCKIYYNIHCVDEYVVMIII